MAEFRRKAAFTDHLTNGYRGSVLAIVSTPTEYTCVVSRRGKWRKTVGFQPIRPLP